jgi:RNA polymerase sigma-70 factor, ECF subfamily
MQGDAGRRPRDDVYREVAAEFGAALERLARAYEPDAEKRRDLLQEMHAAVWQSLDRFDGRCSMRTWVYRVAHNVATSVVLRRRRPGLTLVGLDEVPDAAEAHDREREIDERRALDRLLALVRTLKPIDRQVMVLYLEGVDAAGIAEVTGLSAANVATKVHRIKQLLVRRFHEGSRHGA